MLGKILAFIFGGLILSMIGMTLVGFAAPINSTDAVMGPAFFVFVVIAGAIAFTAPRGAKAWRRLLITSGILCLALPLASMVMTGNVMAEIGAQGGDNVAAGQAGAAIGGGIAAMFTGFVSVFAAAILLIVGFLVGRDKQIVYVQQGSAGE